MLRTLPLVAFFSLLGGLAPLAFAEKTVEPAAETPDTPAAEEAIPAGHSHFGEAFNAGPRQRARRMSGVGAVDFPITTDNPEAQAFFTQGMGQYYGFWFLEAERSFRQAAALDPNCAMAYWGAAFSTLNNAKRAEGFLEKAKERAAGVTRREQMYIDALDHWLDFDAKKEKKERAKQHLADLQAIVDSFPEDTEARALLALAYYRLKRDAPIKDYGKVDAILQSVFDDEPLHPAHHFRIHLWDVKEPVNALASAARCGQAAPSIAHMWHMPGHIYSRLHRYADAAWQQEASARVDHAAMMRDQVMPDEIHNFAHNNEWLIRNLIYVGRVQDALDLAKNMISLPRHPRYNTLTKRGSAYYGRRRLFDVLAAYELDEQCIALCETAALEPTGDEEEQVRRLRALGVALARGGHSKRADDVRRELTRRLESLRAEAEQKRCESYAKAYASGKSPRDIQKAVDQAVKSTANRMSPIEKALAALEGSTAVAAGDYRRALEKLRAAGGEDNARLAYYQALAGELDPAWDAVVKEVHRRPGQIIPLLFQARIAMKREKPCEAWEALARIEAIGCPLDLSVPLIADAAQIATTLDYPADFSRPYAAPADVGVRPALDKLGPLCWEPPPATGFKLSDSAGHEHQLKDFRGRPVVLIFYLGYGCLHCAEQLQAFAPKYDAFREAGIEVVGISVDDRQGVKNSLETYDGGKMPFLLLADPGHTAFKSYRAYDDFERMPLHGTFLIDGRGRIRWQDIGYEPFMEPDFVLDEAQRLLGQDEAAQP